MQRKEINRELFETVEILEGHIYSRDITITALLRQNRQLREELRDAKKLVSKNQILSCKPKAAKVIGCEENMPIPIRALD